MRKWIALLACLCLLSVAALAEDGAPDVVVNELMASNKSVLRDTDGDLSDWIELWNAGETSVSLEGWAISDVGYDGAWVFPAIELAPDDYLIVFASGKNRAEGELHADFKLSSDGETVTLFDADGAIASEAIYGSVKGDESISRLEDGTTTNALPPTPGAANTEAAAEAASRVAGTNALGLVVNEALAAGAGNDWVEIANTSGAAIDLAGFGLSDDLEKPLRWRFPEGASIDAGALVVVELVGKDGEAGEWSANFALSEGEAICLSDPDGVILDKIELTDVMPNVSIGRAAGETTFRAFETPTPGEANAAVSYTKKLSPVTFSQGGGAHEEARLVLEMRADDGATIYYTTDGSVPTASSFEYKSSLAVREATTFRAVAMMDGAIPSDVATLTLMPGEPTKLRVVCVAGDARGLSSGSKKDAAVVFAEAYDPDGTQLFAQDLYMKMSGHSSRVENAQKAFSLRARKSLGDGWIRAALFSNRDYEKYKSIVMRASGQDSEESHMLDSILTSLAADTPVYYQETEVCSLFVNGQYWGVYNMRERMTPESLAQFHGWDDADSVNLVEDSGANAYAAKGSSEGYRALLSWVKNHDLSDNLNVRELREKMDIESYLDYVALQMYCNNQDLDNVRCYNCAGADERWRWAIFDLDLAFWSSKNAVSGWLNGSKVGSITSQDNTLFPRLMKNARLRAYFLNRMAELLKTTFSAENVVGKIDARAALIDADMQRNCARWNWSYSTWQSAVERIKTTAQSRPEKLRQDLIDAFNLSAEEAVAIFGVA